MNGKNILSNLKIIESILNSMEDKIKEEEISHHKILDHLLILIQSIIVDLVDYHKFRELMIMLEYLIKEVLLNKYKNQYSQHK